MKQEIHYVDDEVLIPNLEGDGIGERIKVRIPVTIDPHTGEEMLTEEAFEILETTKARHMGLLLPEQIKALRERLQLSQKEMSRLLQAGEKSYTRWESGRARPSRLVNVLLRSLDDGELSLEYLRSQREVDEDWNKIVNWDFSQPPQDMDVTFDVIAPVAVECAEEPVA